MKQTIHNIVAGTGTVALLVPMLALVYASFYPEGAVAGLFVRLIVAAAS